MIPRFIPSRPAAAGGTNNATVTAWRAQVITNGGTVSAGRRTLLDTLFNAGAATWLPKASYFPMLGAENTQQALLDIIGLRTLTPVGAPTFTVDRGYTFSGSNYIDSGFNPATMGIGTQNDFSIAVWDRTVASLQRVELGSEFNTNGSGFILPQAGNAGFYQVNSAGTGPLSAQTSNGFWQAMRTGANAAQCFKNGSSVNIDTVSTSNAIQSANFAIGADFTGGGPGTPCTDQLALVCIGAAMTSVAAAFYADLATYAAAVGF